MYYVNNSAAETTLRPSVKRFPGPGRATTDRCNRLLNRHLANRWVSSCRSLNNLFSKRTTASSTTRSCPPQNNRRGDEDRGICAHYHPDDDRQRKVTQHRTPNQK